MENRSGMVLLESLVALVVFALAASALTATLIQALEAVRTTAEAESELRAASAFLDAVVLWPATDLDRRLGDRQQGPWRLKIDRPHPNAYRIEVADSTGARILLQTAVYRHSQHESLSD